MRTRLWPDRPGGLAWLALSGLALIATALAAGVWVALRAEAWGARFQQLVNACLLVSASVGEGLWLWPTHHPLAALALGFLTASLAWALVRLGLSLRGGWRVRTSLTRYAPGEFPVLDRALALCREIDPRRVRVLGSAAPEAFTLGLLRPRICLSAGLLGSMTDTELQLVLRHEQAHVTARDPLRLAAARLLSDFLWFLPLGRALADAFTALAEFRADEAAVSAGGDPLDLSSAIVKTARGASAGPRLAPALGGLELVEQRVMRLLGRERGFSVPIPLRAALASGLVLFAVLGILAGPSFGRASPSPDPVVVMRSMMTRMMADCVGDEDPGSVQPLNPGGCESRLMDRR